MAQFFIVRDLFSLKKCQQWLAEMLAKHGWFKITITTQKRSLDANALSHVWYAEIARQKGDMTAHEYRLLCKLHHGVPILRKESEEFRAFYDRLLINLDYQEKLGAMNYIDVSRVMNKTQMTEYMNAIQNTYGPQGVVLSNAKEAAGI